MNQLDLSLEDLWDPYILSLLLQYQDHLVDPCHLWGPWNLWGQLNRFVPYHPSGPLNQFVL